MNIDKRQGTLWETCLKQERATGPGQEKYSAKKIEGNGSETLSHIASRWYV
jgi:hypothetical protein